MDNGTTILTKSEGLCKVCGDKASGKHYGVASCDGCRGFFKRSIRRNLEYVCKENGRCIVDVTRRNQCQACRFKKCLQVNMKRDAVQHERAPRAPQPTLHPYPGLCFGARLRGLHPAGLFAAFPLHHQALDAAPITPLPTHPLHPSLLYPGLMTKPMDLLASGIKFPSPCIQKQDYSAMLNSGRGNMNDDEVTSSEEALKDKITLEESQDNRKSVLELPLFNDGFRSGIRSTEALSFSLFPAENIYESAAKLLFLSIKWVKTIPSFLQLPYRDQSILLEESWSELFVLTAAQWSLSIDEALLVSNAVAPSTRHSFLKEDARKLRDIITRLTLLRVDHTEHACLKALVLFKPESRGLCEPSRVELLQDQTHVMLHEYCNQRQTSPKGRFGKLLLTLPAIKAVTRQSLEELLFRQTVGNVSIDKLLGDLAKVTH